MSPSPAPRIYKEREGKKGKNKGKKGRKKGKKGKKEERKKERKEKGGEGKEVKNWLKKFACEAHLKFTKGKRV